MQKINNYILEKLHIGKDVVSSGEVKDQQSFIDYLKENGCIVNFKRNDPSCRYIIYLAKNEGTTHNGIPLPYVIIYMYDRTWDITDRSKTGKVPTGLRFHYGATSYSEMKYYQFKRGGAPRGGYGLFYNEENAEKIVNKLQYVDANLK